MQFKLLNVNFVVALGMLAAMHCASARAQTGACCLSPVGEIDCVEMLELDCSLAGGVYGGDGSACPSEFVVTAQMGSASTQLFLNPLVGCQDVGTTGPECIAGPLVDAWVVAPPGPSSDTCHTFGSGFEAPPIPADFFGPGSDPFFGQVCFVGEPLGPTPFGDYGIADTLVLRSSDPFDRCDLPDPAQSTVEIQIVELNLVSSQPIVVTFNGGQDPQLWDVRMNLSQEPSPPGTLNATKTHCNGGTYQSQIPVLPRFTFIDVNSPSNVQVFDHAFEGAPPILFQSAPTPWVLELDPGVSNGNPTCTEFHPAIEDSDPPPTCLAPEQIRALVERISAVMQLLQEPAVTCDPAGSIEPICTNGPLIDPWVTLPGGSCHAFGNGPDSPPIPAGFFGPGSEPFFGDVCFVGVPVGSTGFGNYDVADTLVLRSSDPFDRCDIPDPGQSTVDIQIVELSLRSLQPIQVIVSGQPTLWDVHVDLSTIGVPLGTMTATKTHCNGGTYNSQLLVQPRFTFTNVDNPGQIQIYDTGQFAIPPIPLTTQNAPWVSDLDLRFDPDAPGCTDFHPGLDDPAATSDCDCQTNGVHDACDLESGTSSDCNADATPDECSSPSLYDFDINGIVDLRDHEAFVQCFGGPGVIPSGSPECSDFCLTAFDQDLDSDIDLRDFRGFSQAFGGR